MSASAPNLRALPQIGGPAAFAAAFPISRESLDRLETYADLLQTWQRTMNLVAPKTLPELWHRHMADSAQIVALAPGDGHWVDFGAGAGFPGLVAAIMRADKPVAEGTRHSLVESDARKCAFLGEVVRKTELSHVFPVDILCARIEAPATRARLGTAKVVSARAVASLREILALSAPLFGPETVGFFPKGRGVDAEIVEAEEQWRFQHRLWPSRTEPEAMIVEIRGPEQRPRT